MARSCGHEEALLRLVAYLGETRCLLLGSMAVRRCAFSSGSSAVLDGRTCPRSKLQACLPSTYKRRHNEWPCSVFNVRCSLLVKALYPSLQLVEL